MRHCSFNFAAWLHARVLDIRVFTRGGAVLNIFLQSLPSTILGVALPWAICMDSALCNVRGAPSDILGTSSNQMYTMLFSNWVMRLATVGSR